MGQHIRLLVVVLAGLVLAASCGTRVDTSVATTAGATGTVAGGPTASGAAVPANGATATADGTANDAGGTSGGTEAATGPGAAGTASATGPASGEPIVLGAVGTRSGIVGAALENSWRGLPVWEKSVNARGGIAGHPVKVIIADDGGDPGKHAAAVRQLITEDHVVAFIGNFAPLTFSAGVPTLESAGVAAIGGDSAEAGWFRSPMAFPINDSTLSRSRPAAKWGLANLPQRKAAVFYVSDIAAPKAIADEFTRVWQAGGGQVVVEAGVSIAQPDFTAEVIRAKSAGADLVFMVLERAACNRFFSAARRQQYSPVFMAPACTIDTALDNKDLTTNRLYGVSSARPLQRGHSPAEDEALDAAARYDPKMSPDGAFMFAWLGGKLLEAALAQPGTTPTAAGIIDALHRLPATTLGGLTPQESWPPGPHSELGCGIITRFDGTRFVPMTEDFLC